MLTNLTWALFAVALFASIKVVVDSRNNVKNNKNEVIGKLSAMEKFLVFLGAFFAPIVSNAVVYYGIKGVDLEKAKKANLIGWIGFFVGMAVYFVIMRSI